jgi:hypothetical protein
MGPSGYDPEVSALKIPPLLLTVELVATGRVGFSKITNCDLRARD